MGDIAANYRLVKERIGRAKENSGRQGEEITLVAVTKAVTPGVIREAVALGINNFGENRVQEVLPKIEELPGDITWHFIGHLQGNKVKFVLPRFALIHSLDRLSLAKEINRQAEKLGKVVEVLVQVDIAGEETKYGLAPGETGTFIETVAREYPFIKVKGLMTMAPFEDDPEEVRPVFRELKKMSAGLQVPGVELKELSMGMTNDYEVAVEEGATIVRIGTALFKGGYRD